MYRRVLVAVMQRGDRITALELKNALALKSSIHYPDLLPFVMLLDGLQGLPNRVPILGIDPGRKTTYFNSLTAQLIQRLVRQDIAVEPERRRRATLTG
ncbi:MULTISPECIES: hypothetical protein [Pseudoxanthomonas]|uniref:Uncharacterized protein n=1 Tax=Pseudoxanthomonas winnipegensis TaxID=2480810 RepID=A0AAW8GBC3_9GAMM|nr:MULTISPECIES: hypothetical protein [Pseudoxanthomonas]MDQ1118339.1 hypothetical protein [Pseudoxanthomonas winnipegensis]MDQ1131521.1 hypothetical protein [Pseudoxanthomonas winnipegensis]MDR6138462.1 hypothetical protein [Pseudoxanthomonas sp. SORGH_AS_0997]